MYMQRTVVTFRKCFDDSGLADTLLEARTVAQGSLPWVMEGRHYNRSVRVIKIMAEALRRKLLSIFMDTQSKEEKNKFIVLSKSLYHTLPKTQFQRLYTSRNFKEFKSKLSLFIQERCSQFPTFAFWMTYQNMIDLFLHFVYTKWIGNWALHLQSAAEMIPWYFSHDHLNYARYLLVYIYEMLGVPLVFKC